MSSGLKRSDFDPDRPFIGIANSAVIKQTAVEAEMLVHSGPAKVFFTEKDLLDAIEGKKIKEGDVVVLPFQGRLVHPVCPKC